MAAGPWIWGEEWGRSGSESMRTFVVLCRCWGVPLQEKNPTVFLIGDSGYRQRSSAEYLIHQQARLARQSAVHSKGVTVMYYLSLYSVLRY